MIKAIKLWARNRNLHTAKPRDQFLKVVEEVGELGGSLARNNEDGIKDAIGDIVVTLVVLSETLGYDYDECIKLAYDEIKDRKGKLVDGIFIKEVE